MTYVTLLIWIAAATPQYAVQDSYIQKVQFYSVKQCEAELARIKDRAYNLEGICLVQGKPDA